MADHLLGRGGVVAVTGRRDIAGGRERVRAELDRLITKLEPSLCVSGVALGADTVWAQAALDAGRPLAAYVPFPQQPSKWPQPDQDEWLRLVNAADQVRMFGTRYDVRFFHARNEAMVDAADVVIAVWERDGGGGTGAAVAYAKRCGRPIVHVDFVTGVTVLETPAAQ